MQQDQWRPRARAQIAHAGSVNLHPALFHVLAERWTSTGRYLLYFIRHKNLLTPDNRFPPPGLYLRERLCRFTWGASAPRFFFRNSS